MDNSSSVRLDICPALEEFELDGQLVTPEEAKELHRIVKERRAANDKENPS